MANGDTKTEQMLDVLANGGSTAAFKGCCNTKTQNYILDAADRIQAVEDEVERLENNPDVVDIVATYADLQAYDTQHLTDKDVIRVLQDETHDGDSTYYRYNKQADTWTYIGESKQYTNFVGTDGTTAGEAGLVPAPAIADAGKFLKADGTWAEAAGGGGGAVQLTTADYDYPEGTPDGVALWRLDPGLYNWDNQKKVYTSNATTITTGASAFVTEAAGNAKDYIEVLAFVPSGGVSGTYSWFKVSYSTGAKLNNISNVHFLTDKGVVQTTGTSKTDVMSQKAVTDMVFNSNILTEVQIGQNASASSTMSVAIGGGASAALAAQASAAQSVAIGTGARANHRGSISFGSATSAQGEMNVKTYGSGNGYNSTDYRLITGVYDGQDAHDAVTVEQVNATIDAINTALSVNIPHIGASS